MVFKVPHVSGLLDSVEAEPPSSFHFCEGKCLPLVELPQLDTGTGPVYVLLRIV